MAELQTYLTGIADAIRSKKGTTAPINAKDFASEIRNIAGSGGSGGGAVEVPPVTNLAVDKNYNLTFTKPDVTELVDNGAVISYVATVNDVTVEDIESGDFIGHLLKGGENIISVIIQATYSNDDGTISYYSKEQTVVALSTTIPTKLIDMGTATIGDYVYLFGGSINNNSNGKVNTIYKFDTVNKTIVTLSTTLPQTLYYMGTAVYGTNVYLFGGSTYNSSTGSSEYCNTIYKFNSVNETITKLSTTLPQTLWSMGIATIGTNIYIFGGSVSNGYSYSKKIYKFDTTSETLTTLSQTLPQTLWKMATVTVDNDVYIFGGQYNATKSVNTIYRFNGLSETVTTLSTTLPQVMSGLRGEKIGDTIYLFGYENLIYKFFINNRIIVTMPIVMPKSINSMGTEVVGNVVYIFGGMYQSTYYNTIYKFE